MRCMVWKLNWGAHRRPVPWIARCVPVERYVYGICLSEVTLA